LAARFERRDPLADDERDDTITRAPEGHDVLVDRARDLQRALAAAGLSGVHLPVEYGGRGLPHAHANVVNEELRRFDAPSLRPLGIGMHLAAATLLASGSAAQKARYLPALVRAEEQWCQLFSEPDAGSDLASLRCRAVLDGDEWVIDGQKVWTSQAHWADWCFVLARTDRDAPRHKGISYLLVPMRQSGVEIRPIIQITGDSEFNEVFFTGARTPVDHVVGEVNEGWAVAMGTLAFERGVSTLGQNFAFVTEWEEILERARGNGRTAHAAVRQRAVELWIRLQLMRLNTLRVMSAGPVTPPAATITKLFWASLHRDLGEFGVDVVGDGDPDDRLRRLFLFSRADTIYGGSNQVQRNIIGERALGLPREPR
jgi:alkylation response protein AidB-like acyl-CoA dehydrogenase